MKKFFFILVAGSFLFLEGCVTHQSSLLITAHAEKHESFLGCCPAYDVDVTYALVAANR